MDYRIKFERSFPWPQRLNKSENKFIEVKNGFQSILTNFVIKTQFLFFKNNLNIRSFIDEKEVEEEINSLKRDQPGQAAMLKVLRKIYLISTDMSDYPEDLDDTDFYISEKTIKNFEEKVNPFLYEKPLFFVQILNNHFENMFMNGRGDEILENLQKIEKFYNLFETEKYSIWSLMLKDITLRNLARKLGNSDRKGVKHRFTKIFKRKVTEIFSEIIEQIENFNLTDSKLAQLHFFLIESLKIIKLYYFGLTPGVFCFFRLFERSLGEKIPILIEFLKTSGLISSKHEKISERLIYFSHMLGVNTALYPNKDKTGPKVFEINEGIENNLLLI